MTRAGRKPVRYPQKRRESPRLDAWRRSPRFKAVALHALEVARAVLAARPKCGAKRKRDGQPCQQPGLANGKCKFHGGRTPAGAGWHRIRLPSKGEVRGLEIFEKKVADKQKRDAQRRQRLALMSPEQRMQYEAWQASHQPGPASARAHRRQQLKTKAMLDELRRVAEAKSAAEDLRRLALQTDHFRNYREGVFA